MALRVLHVTDSLAPQAGAVAISLAGLCRVLRSAGVESTVIADTGHADWSDDDTQTAPALPDSISKRVSAADVIHLHGFGTSATLQAGKAARQAGRAYVIAPLGYLTPGPHNNKNWRHHLQAWLRERPTVRRAARLQAINAVEQRRLVADYGADRVAALPYGLDMEQYAGSAAAPAEGKAQPRKCLLLLAPIHPVEGFGPLLKAFAEVASDVPDWHVVLGGPARGDWKKMLEAAIRRKGASDRVTFAPAANPQAQRGLLAQATVLASPSLHVRCPVSILQAAAAGVPVLASPQSVSDELAQTVRVCPPTLRDMRNALQHLLSCSEDDRAAMAERALSRAKGLYDWSVLGDRYVHLYESLLCQQD